MPIPMTPYAYSTSRPFDGCAYEHNPAARQLFARAVGAAGGEPKPEPPQPPKPDEPMPLPRCAGVHGATTAG